MQIPISKAHRLLSPRIVYLVSSINGKGIFNAAPISNLTSVSNAPQRVALAICPKWNTYKNIRLMREFVINIPSKEMLDAVWVLGDKYSGNIIPPNVNKVNIAGFHIFKSNFVLPPKLVECYAHLECKVVWIKSVGDHMLILADVLDVDCEDMALSNDLVVNTKLFLPIMQVSGSIFTHPTESTISPNEEKVKEIIRSIKGLETSLSISDYSP